MGFDFTVIVPLLLSHCDFFFVFGCGVSFLVSSSVLMSMIDQQVVVICNSNLLKMFFITQSPIIIKVQIQCLVVKQIFIEYLLCASHC